MTAVITVVVVVDVPTNPDWSTFSFSKAISYDACQKNTSIWVGVATFYLLAL